MLKSQFPFFKKNKNLIYFDNAATSQKFARVIAKEQEFYEEFNANPHSAIYDTSLKMAEICEETRRNCANFINIPNKNRKKINNIIFTSGTTDSINLVAAAWGGRFIKQDDEIILSIAEHHSNIVAWQILAAEKNAKIIFLPILENGKIDLDRLQEKISKKTKLVSFSLISNVLGVKNDLEKVRKIIGKNIMFCVDAAQAIAHYEIDTEKLQCDFLAFSTHKVFGPTGLGILYINQNIINEMPHYRGGGDMVAEVTTSGFTTTTAPAKFEAGTLNLVAIAAFSEMMNLVKKYVYNSQNYLKDLTEYAFTKLGSFSQVKIISPRLENYGIIAFTVEKIHSHDIAQFLNQFSIAIRSGQHCAMPLLKFLEVTDCCRMSFAIYNNKSEIDFFCDKLAETIKFFS